MDLILKNWQLLLPLLILQLGFQIFALIDLFKRDPEEIKGSKVLWAIVILVFQMLGPIFYLVFGRR
jgi:predicted ABC-type exoprotein transport system permease subunit